jgi:hypothetical protein
MHDDRERDVLLTNGDKAVVFQYWDGIDIRYRVVSENGVLRDVAQQGEKHIEPWDLKRFLS